MSKTQELKEKIKEFSQQLNVYDVSSGAIDDGNSMLIALIKESRGFVDSVTQNADDIRKEAVEDYIGWLLVYEFNRCLADGYYDMEYHEREYKANVAAYFKQRESELVRPKE